MPNPPTSKRILVTGGSGFVGQHLLRALLGAGYRPVATTRSLSGLGVTEDLRSAVNWVEVDLNYPPSVAPLGETGWDTVFHLAGVRVSEGAPGAVERNLEGNFTATENLLKVLGSSWNDGRFLAVGSAEEYGFQDGPMTEQLPLRPVTSYGGSKARMTELVLKWASNARLSATVLRPFTVYGPGQPGQMFVAQAITHAVAGRPFAMTEGQQKRDLVFVSDVVTGLMSAMTAPVAIEGNAINLGSGKSTSLLEVAEMVWHLSSSTAPLVIGGRPGPPHELHDTCADISRARRWLNWSPQVPLDAGLQATIEWDRSEQNALRN
jgi:nucleoside-diphosphate-sugar epimerase